MIQSITTLKMMTFYIRIQNVTLNKIFYQLSLMMSAKIKPFMMNVSIVCFIRLNVVRLNVMVPMIFLLI
jgi:hypothetical protein